MILFKKARDINHYITKKKELGFTAGFIPTMGALHQGHISLLQEAKKPSSITVCSIFVNPTQFNDHKDFENYPSTIERDIDELEKAGCDILFLPTVHEMYPSGTEDLKKYDLGYLETVLEGKFRPGHFQGVCQIVNRLLEIIPADHLYLGQKDYQQCMVITKLIELTGMKTKINICPTLREPDGLAMSSRNRRLSSEEREKAPLIAELLFKSATFVPVKSIQDTISFVTQGLAKDPVFRLEYFEIVDGETLQPVENWEDSSYIVGCIAIYCGPVRLIDNVVYKQ